MLAETLAYKPQGVTTIQDAEYRLCSCAYFSLGGKTEKIVVKNLNQT